MMAFRFWGLGWGWLFLVLSSFPLQGLADPNMYSSVHALCLVSARTDLLIFFPNLVAVYGGYSHSINIEIQLDACSLGGELVHFMYAYVPWPCIKHRLWHPTPWPTHCQGLSSVPKTPFHFSLSFFSQKIKNRFCNGAPLKVKASSWWCSSL